jgi:membrane protein
MSMSRPHASTVVLPSPRALLDFTVRVARGFSRNGSLVLAGAIAYNALLSLVPLLLLASALFSRFVDRQRFLGIVRRWISEVVPTQKAEPVIEGLMALLEAPYTGGAIGFITLIFFSTLAFSTLAHALDVIFVHRRVTHGARSTFWSVAIAVGYVFAFAFVALLQTRALVTIDAVPWLANEVAAWEVPVAFLAVAALVSSIYVVMPVGIGSVRAALIGGLLAALMWRGVQMALGLYLERISGVNVIYGSLAAVIVVLLSFELAAMIVLLCAQVVAEVELAWLSGNHWFEDPEKPSQPPPVPARPSVPPPPSDARPSAPPGARRSNPPAPGSRSSNPPAPGSRRSNPPSGGSRPSKPR